MFLHHLSPEKWVHPESENSLEIHSNVAWIDDDPAVHQQNMNNQYVAKK